MECRCCGAKLPEKALLKLENMPKSAQFFPNWEEAENETGVCLELYECSYCGLLQLSGEPVPYFRDVIRATGVSEEMRAFREAQFSEWVERNSLRGKKVLEIGCGNGDYMACMEKAGADVCGIEHGEAAFKEALSAGHRVFRLFLENERTVVEGAPYDGFFIMNFLEHLPKPGPFLRAIANNLALGAYGIVEVPNTDMILEQGLYSELIQDHLLYFREDTLRRMLEWNGFEVLSCKKVCNDYIISAEVRRKKPLDVSDLLKKREETRQKCHEFFRKMRSAGKKIAVWGAGHQALANLSLLDMKDYIDIVVDSASFKQKKLTPATHIPVESPHILTQGNVGAVLVMAGSYSEEVSSLVKENHPEIVCAVLRENGNVEEIRSGGGN